MAPGTGHSADGDPPPANLRPGATQAHSRTVPAPRGILVNVQLFRALPFVGKGHEQIGMPARELFTHRGADAVLIRRKNLRRLHGYVEIAVIYRLDLHCQLNAAFLIFSLAEPGHAVHSAPLLHGHSSAPHLRIEHYNTRARKFQVFLRRLAISSANCRKAAYFSAPCARISLNCSSPIILMPSFFALSSLLPALSPAMTKVVLDVTEL